MFLSIIVPVYNTSQFLGRCVDSLLHQGLDEADYEIVLVNDGSKDNSLEICRDYASRYPNVKVVDKENGGVSSARNSGVQIAQGEFVCFVDSDDYLLEGGYGYIKQHFDCKAYDVIRFWSAIETADAVPPKVLEGKETFSGTGHEFLAKYGLEMFCYNSLYRLAFLKTHGLEYRPYRVGEDYLFATSVLLECPRILSVSSRIYRYVVHSNSASTNRNPDHMRKCVVDQLDVHDEMLSLLQPVLHDEKSPLYRYTTGYFLHPLMPQLLSRCLSAGMTVAEFKRVIDRCRNNELWPIKILPAIMQRKERVFFRVINFLGRHPWLFPSASFLYTRFFVPFILKHFDRNKL